MERPPPPLPPSAHPPGKPTSNSAGGKLNHVPKDPNCEVRRRMADRLKIAERFRDLITADHKVLNEEQESRMHHKYAVVVQDLATQRIQSYPCKTESAQDTQRGLRTFSLPEENPRSIYTDNSLDYIKACEGLNWNHERSTPHRSETNGIAERAARQVNEGISSVLVQSGLQESWWAEAMECTCYLRHWPDAL